MVEDLFAGILQAVCRGILVVPSRSGHVKNQGVKWNGTWSRSCRCREINSMIIGQLEMYLDLHMGDINTGELRSCGALPMS